MCEILIFGGTTEGRLLAEFCGREKIEVWVSVVSGYGKELLPGSPWIHVTEGALDQSGIEAFIREKRIRLVIDATHPYARNVSENIRAACGTEHAELIRCLREEEEMPDGVFQVADAKEAADFLRDRPGKILVTTGSHELEAFCRLPDFRERVYVRVLPSSRVLEKCEELGIPGSHICAAQGPFSEAANRLALEETGASWLVTKSSGKAGGFSEKLSAAASLGVSVVVVRRPSEEGISWRAICRILESYSSQAGAKTEDAEKTEKTFRTEKTGPQMRQTEAVPREEGGEDGFPEIVLAGIGMGNPSLVTGEVRDAICKSTVIFGAGRMLETASAVPGGGAGKNTMVSLIETYRPDAIMERIEKLKSTDRVTVLYSGDTGFYSGMSGLAERLREREIPFRIMPGVSSISYFSARLGIAWEDAAFYTAHGRTLNMDAVREEKRRKIFVLTGGENGAGMLCGALTSAGLGECPVAVGERLSYPDERIRKGKARELAKEHFAALSLVLIEKEAE